MAEDYVYEEPDRNEEVVYIVESEISVDTKEKYGRDGAQFRGEIEARRMAQYG
jgi:hypothetical protein